MEKRTWFDKRQKQFLTLVNKDKNFRAQFYLSGGTALAAVYYNHRVSKDLDFFSRKSFSPEWLRTVVLSTQNELGWQTVRRNQNNINGFVLNWSDKTRLKLDFHVYTFKRVGKFAKALNISIDSPVDIAINKLDAMLTRNQMRDYVDLYTVIKRENVGLSHLLKLHLKKTAEEVDPLVWAKTFLKVSELHDYPLIKTKLPREKLIHFFETEAKKMGAKIFTKLY